MAPIALFAYDRPEHLERAIRSIQANPTAEERTLFVFSDGPGSSEAAPRVAQVRELARAVTGFARVEVIERSENLTGPVGIPMGIAEVCAFSDRVIVLEDDLEVSPGLLSFLDEGLDVYADAREVACVSGFCFPHRRALPQTFFLRGAYSEGWATWRDARATFEPDAASLRSQIEVRGLREAFELGGVPRMAMLQPRDDGREIPWDIRWHASIFLRGGHTLLPNVSLVRNHGFDGSGANVGASRNIFEMPLAADGPRVARAALVSEDPVAREELARCLRSESGFRARIARRLRGR